MVKVKKKSKERLTLTWGIIIIVIGIIAYFSDVYSNFDKKIYGIIIICLGIILIFNYIVKNKGGKK